MADTIKLRGLDGKLTDLGVHDCARFDEGARPCGFCRLNATIGSLAGLYVVPFDIPGFNDISDKWHPDQPSTLHRVWLWDADAADRDRAESIFDAFLARQIFPVLRKPKLV